MYRCCLKQYMEKTIEQFTSHILAVYILFFNTCNLYTLSSRFFVCLSASFRVFLKAYFSRLIIIKYGKKKWGECWLESKFIEPKINYLFWSIFCIIICVKNQLFCWLGRKWTQFFLCGYKFVQKSHYDHIHLIKSID